MQNTVGKQRIIHDLVFWEPLQGKRRKGRNKKNFIKQLEENTAIGRCDLTKMIQDQINWEKFGMLNKMNAD